MIWNGYKKRCGGLLLVSTLASSHQNVFAAEKVKRVKPDLSGVANSSQTQASQAVGKSVVESPIPGDSAITVTVPESLRRQGGKLRIRNLATGKSAVVDTEIFKDNESIPANIIEVLTDEGKAALVPEFTALDYRKDSVRRPGPSDPNSRNQRLEKSLVYDQPTWQDLGFRTERKDKNVLVTLEYGIQNVMLTQEQAEKRKVLVEDAGVNKLFEIGWKSIRMGRYDLALEAFNKIFVRESQLTTEQKNNAHLGRGIASFHQISCEKAMPELSAADADKKNVDDVSYYRSLCLVESKKFKDAEGGFKDLVRKQHPNYSEPSRFYLGIVAEYDERFDEAESAYLDTIDFASDKKLVELAKIRLSELQKKKADYNYDHKWFLGAFTLAPGYDTNVQALPASVDPSARSLNKASDTLFTGVAYLQANLPWSKKFDNKLHYSFVAIHYLDTSIASSSDVQVHDLGTDFVFPQNETTSWETNLGYSSVSTGPFASAAVYATTPSIAVKRKRLYLDTKGKEVLYDAEHSFKLAFLRPQVAQEVEATDVTSNSYMYSYRRASYQRKPYVRGPGLDLEYRAAVGSEVTYFATTGLWRWDLPFGPQNWKLYATQEAALINTLYFKSADFRKDLQARYTGGVARQWRSWFETRLQFIGTYNYSTDSDNYSYSKMQLNLQLNAFF